MLRKGFSLCSVTFPLECHKWSVGAHLTLLFAGGHAATRAVNSATVTNQGSSPRMSLSFAPIITAYAQNAASAVFQVFGVTQRWIEMTPPSWKSSAQLTAPLYKLCLWQVENTWPLRAVSACVHFAMLHLLVDLPLFCATELSFVLLYTFVFGYYLLHYHLCFVLMRFFIITFVMHYCVFFLYILLCLATAEANHITKMASVACMKFPGVGGLNPVN